MRRLVYLDSAIDDFADILRFVTLESGSYATGRAFVSKIRARCAKIASLPGTLGSDRRDLVPGIRSVSCNSYIIFFRYGNERLEIVNVLHSSRDFTAHFDND